MLVYYFAPLDLPFAEAERGLLEAMGVAGAIAEAAYRDGEEIRARIGPGKRPIIAKTVRIVAGEPLRGPRETAVPFTWEATGTPALFPLMEADLLVTAVGPSSTQLLLRGLYRTPLGGPGRALDRMALHRIAEASVKSFVDRLAAFISTGADERAAGARL